MGLIVKPGRHIDIEKGLAQEEVILFFHSFSLFPRFLSSSATDGKPKLPATSYISYFKSVYPDLRKEHPDARVSKIAKIAGTMYRSLSAEDLQKLADERAKAMIAYDQRYSEWKESLTEEDEERLTLEAEEKKAKRKKIKIKSLQKENNMPKRPVSAFTLYYIERIGTTNLQFLTPKQRMNACREVMKESGETWKTLSDSDKEAFVEKAREEHALYESQIELWEADMIKAGNLNLIRRSTLKRMFPKKRTLTKKVVAKIQGVKSTETGAKKSAMKKTGTSKKKKVRFADEENRRDSDSD